MKKNRVKKAAPTKKAGLGKLRKRVRRLKARLSAAGGNGKGNPGGRGNPGGNDNKGKGKSKNCQLSVKLQGQESCNKVALTLSRNGSVVETKSQAQVPSNVVFKNLTQGNGYTLHGVGNSCSGSVSPEFSVGPGNNKVSYKVS